MKLDYIYHSGFAIEADGVTVIIDYYKDSSEEVFNKGIVHDYLLEKPGLLYVLCSHFHPDHFNREVLSWKKLRPDIRYIFSKDILKHRRASAEDATYINKGDTYEDEHIRIQAFGSTDVGISFLIDLQGRRLFHAGDLNNWHWSEESTPQEIRKAEGDFLAEVRELQQTAPARRCSHVSGGQPYRKRLYAWSRTIRGTNKNHYICTDALQRRLSGRQRLPAVCREQGMPLSEHCTPW